MYLKKYKYLILILIGIIQSCAQQIAPTGGPKDETPPRIIKCKPDSFSTLISTQKGQVFSLKFDEFIVIKNKQQISFSPPLKGKGAEYLIKGKVLEIKVEDSLENNKTYTVNFGNAITDNHEYKAFENFNYVFSTGSYIDSGYVSGKILNAFTQKPEKDIIVGLYKIRNYTDTLLYKEPFYYTLCNEDGNFKIKHLPLDTFQILTFKKENGFIYNKTADVGFIKNKIIPSANGNDVGDIGMYSPYKFKKNKLIDVKYPFKNYIKVSMYRSEIKHISIDKDSVIFKSNQLKNPDDSIEIFLAKNTSDTVSFNIVCSDTTYILKAKFNQKLKYKDLQMKRNVSNVKPGKNIVFDLSNPIMRINTAKIKLYKDTMLITPKKIELKNKGFELAIENTFEEGIKYKLQFEDSALVDIYNQISKKLSDEFTVRSAKETGNLKLHFIHYSSSDPYIIQLVSDDEKVIENFILSQDTTMEWHFVEPGNYRVKTIVDNNRNNVWDRGELWQEIIPEKCYYFPEKISLRAYWDMEQTYDLSEINNFHQK